MNFYILALGKRCKETSKLVTQQIVILHPLTCSVHCQFDGKDDISSRWSVLDASPLQNDTHTHTHTHTLTDLF